MRLLSYMMQLWEIQRREWEADNTPPEARRLIPVVPFVFYTGQDNWTTSLRFADIFDAPPDFARFLPTWETLFLDLRRTPSEQLTSFVNSIGWALRALQAERAPYEEIERVLREAMAGLEGLNDELSGQWLRVAWYFLLLVTHRRPDPESERLYRVIREQAQVSKFHVREEWQIMETTHAENLIEQGEVRGEAKGLRSSLEIVLTEQFGDLSEEVKAALATADLDTLNDWLRTALRVQTLEEIGIAAPQ